MLTMEECLRETPLRLKDMINTHPDLFKEVAQRDFKRVVISGSGSSFHAGTGAKLYMQKTMGIPVDVIYPFQAEDYLFTQPSETLFIGISQSGTSLSAVRAMEHAKAQGCVLASMAGRRDEGVILDTVADYILTVPCGEEGDLQPKTKGFLCTIVNLQLLAASWALAHGRLDDASYQETLRQLSEVADNMPNVLDDAKAWIDKYGQMLAQSHDIRLVGTKDIFGIVLEGTLKLVETLRVPVGGYEFEEFIHGVYNAINQDSLVVLLDTGREPRMKTLKEVLSQWSDYIMIAGASAQDDRDFVVRTKGYEDFYNLEYSLLLFSICSQVSAMKGIDIQTTKDTSFHAKLGSKVLR